MLLQKIGINFLGISNLITREVKRMGKCKMTKAAARRIQLSQDKKGSKGDQGFKSRAMKAAAKNGKSK